MLPLSPAEQLFRAPTDFYGSLTPWTLGRVRAKVLLHVIPNKNSELDSKRSTGSGVASASAVRLLPTTGSRSLCVSHSRQTLNTNQVLSFEQRSLPDQGSLSDTD